LSRNVKAPVLDIVADPAPVEFLDGAMAVGVLTWVREQESQP